MIHEYYIYIYIYVYFFLIHRSHHGRIIRSDRSNKSVHNRSHISIISFILCHVKHHNTLIRSNRSNKSVHNCSHISIISFTSYLCILSVLYIISCTIYVTYHYRQFISYQNLVHTFHIFTIILIIQILSLFHKTKSHASRFICII